MVRSHTTQSNPAPELRRGTVEDARACHDLLWETVTDLGRRQGTPLDGSAEDWWRSGESLHRLLADHGAEWWIAEAPSTRRLLGYSPPIFL